MGRELRRGELHAEASRLAMPDFRTLKAVG